MKLLPPIISILSVGWYEGDGSLHLSDARRDCSGDEDIVLPASLSTGALLIGADVCRSSRSNTCSSSSIASSISDSATVHVPGCGGVLDTTEPLLWSDTHAVVLVGDHLTALQTIALNSSGLSSEVLETSLRRSNIWITAA